MASRILATLLGLALLVSIGLNISVRRRVTRLNFEYFPNMVRTPRYNAFEENPNFSDGMTLRAPVPGTIPRGLPPLGDVLTLDNPFRAEDRAALDRGARVFANFCQPCHGTSGQGGGQVVLHGFPAPPQLTRDETRRMSDGQLFGILTRGTGNMPGYASQISREDRWKAILHVRQLQRTPPAGGAK